MNTEHIIHFTSAENMAVLADDSIDLVVTSPPYPMIQMWDELFTTRNEAIGRALDGAEGERAFNLMHADLDRVWEHLPRVMREGGIVCINIGDAVRTLNGCFQLFSNHTRIVQRMLALGFDNLPNIIWRKATNAPNKFMGSGMLPPGAYVTLEHEFILIFRKGNKRLFKTETEKNKRRESAFFWEERNQWFSDIWFGLKGATQDLKDRTLRERSAAFPLELAYRLINMFSVRGDTVLDPYLGTGTTMAAAAASGRNSVGFELDASLDKVIEERMNRLPETANVVVRERVERHRLFVEERQAAGKHLKFLVTSLGLPCVSRQECGLLFELVDTIERTAAGTLLVSYRPLVTADGSSK
ncbi:MAG TPA: site-specific DNA-methyltransferase [candidate division Zixibacteria bacterium]|nr:site-specific DNA-methyltransferase [candidate division Zixibacteria bacterium]